MSHEPVAIGAERKHTVDITMLLVLLSACAHMTASWEFTPDAQVAIPSADVAIVADEERCRHIADALVTELRSRDGTRVSPDSRVRLVLSHCGTQVRAEVDVTQLYPGLASGLTGGTERLDEVLRATGSVALTVEIDGRPVSTLGARGHRVARVGDHSGIKTRLNLTSGVARDLAAELAQQMVPQPEHVRRRIYRDPEPGSADALHNQAVAAERAGDLQKALVLAKRAQGANPTRSGQSYVAVLESRLSQRRYVESD